MLAADAWRDAWRPSLRLAFEQLARRQRAEAARAGRRLPEDDEAFAIVSGTLRADAALTMTGVSLSVEIDSMIARLGDPVAAGAPSPGHSARRDPGTPASEIAVSGGIVVTVVGALAAERVDAWRAGRRIRMPVQLAPAVALPRSRRARLRARARARGDDAGRNRQERGARRSRSRAAGWFDEAAAPSARSRGARSRGGRPLESASRRRSSRPSSSATAPGSTTTCSGGCRRRAPIT